MSEKINLSINGQCQVPPGFRFHPTEEELLNYYLRKKVAYEKIDLDVIREVDLNKLEPWDIQETCRIGSTPQNDWYFFSHKDKKYPTGTRTNRATAAGFWKATGRDKIIYSGCKRIGLRKTLVFYKGRAPHGQKSDWIMHEYRLDDNNLEANTSNALGESVTEDGWVVCRVFKKKNYLKTLDSPKSSSTSMDQKSSLLNNSNSDGVLDQILLYMGRSCKTENEAFRNRVNISSNEEDDDNNKFGTPSNSFGFGSFEALQEKFMHLPRLESPSLQPPFALNTSQFDGSKTYYQTLDEMFNEPEPSSNTKQAGWAALDRLVASQLNGQLETPDHKQLSCFTDQINTEFGASGANDGDGARLSQLHSSRSDQSLHVYNGENDIWSFTNSSSPSSSDPLCHLSV